MNARSCFVEPAADLRCRRVGQRRSIAEDNRWHCEIAIVDLSYDRSGLSMIFNVDLMEIDSGTRKL
jgi:hypothetical protein